MSDPLPYSFLTLFLSRSEDSSASPSATFVGPAIPFYPHPAYYDLNDESMTVLCWCWLPWPPSFPGVNDAIDTFLPRTDSNRVSPASDVRLFWCLLAINQEQYTLPHSLVPLSIVTCLTFYVSELPTSKPVDEPLNLVHLGPLEPISVFPKKLCIFFSFLDGTHRCSPRIIHSSRQLR